MTYKTWHPAVAIAAGILGGAVALIATPSAKEPCIDNFRDGWFYYMEQSELMDTDDTEAEKQFHNVIVSVVKEQGNLYISKTGREYVVPSYCYAEDTGFSVKLWKK
jgi:hypothetical protein